jgi:chromosome segregation ATPase
MTKLEKEYRKVSAHLEPIRKRAQESPEIREATKAFRGSVREKILELEPQARGWLGRSHDLEQEIRAAKRERADEETLREFQDELDEIREKVERVEVAARADEAVLHERRELRRQVVEKMKRLDDRVPDLLARRREIVHGMRKGQKQ